jgi:hypothetical protein
MIVSIGGGLGWAAAAMARPRWIEPLYSFSGSMLWGVTHGAVSGVITGFGLGMLLQRAGKGLGSR